MSATAAAVSAAPIRRRDFAAVLRSVVLVGVAWGALAALSLSTSTAGDYIAGGPVSGDNPGPALAALVHGNLPGLASNQPAMGLTSILLRAPFVALASWLGGGGLLVYRLGALACLLVLGAFAIWLAVCPDHARIRRLPGTLAATALLVSPIAIAAVRTGHPEEILAAVLATSAVIAALGGRSTWAGVLVGLAIGTKPWALIAVPPVLVALPGVRGRTAAIAGGVTMLTAASLPLADPAAFARASSWVGRLREVNPASLWWPLSTPVHLLRVGHTCARTLPLALTRTTASMIDLGAGAIGVAVVWARGARRGRACDPLALLALLALVRCVGDPILLGYYYVALLVPLAAWEALSLGRAPIVTAFATAGLAAVHGRWLHGAPVARNLASIALTLILGAYLFHAAFGAEAGDRRRLVRPPGGEPDLQPA